jgi:hypothetical protein
VDWRCRNWACSLVSRRCRMWCNHLHWILNVSQTLYINILITLTFNRVNACELVSLVVESAEIPFQRVLEVAAVNTMTSCFIYNLFVVCYIFYAHCKRDKVRNRGSSNVPHHISVAPLCCNCCRLDSNSLLLVILSILYYTIIWVKDSVIPSPPPNSWIHNFI